MFRMAVDHLKNKWELENLRKFAELYSEIYSKNSNLKELTEKAIIGWPE